MYHTQFVQADKTWGGGYGIGFRMSPPTDNIKIVFAVAVSELRVDVLIRFGASAVVVHDERAC